MARWNLMLLALVVFLYATFTAVERHLKCNLPSIANVLCQTYKAGELSGPLCPDLCEQNNIHFGNCLTEVVEDKVYDGQWRGRDVIFKENMRWYTDFKTLRKQTDEDVVLSFEDDVSFFVENLFGDCPQCRRLVSLFLSLGDSDNDGIVTAPEGRSLVSLLHQQEPFMLIALNDSKQTADFYGYCGGIYVTEKLPSIASNYFGTEWKFDYLNIVPDAFEPFQEMFIKRTRKIADALWSIPYFPEMFEDVPALHRILYTLFNIQIPSQKKQFEFFHSLLDTVVDLSSNPYGMIQSCDMHLGNFGITNNSVVKVIDFDWVYPVHYLRHALEQIECVSDADCWFGSKDDCQSSCDTATKTCTSNIQKQDLIHICETHIPYILRNPSNQELSQRNSICVKNAIKKFELFCERLRVVNSIEQLRNDVLAVKKELMSLEKNLSNMC
ncbi:protein FAM69A-like [Stylophora pistillata]|uniref:Protein FAM69A n=1 Tax=Stylophora pistillata TaxID=50429 RepID=A0A2B4S6G5_STYPI|nr:protein FAM69A-like [Stylophora pistillata]XP_022793020.1 protein FAM69A-like [Stylophora pistillata]PFX24177.1 Protein FAM69A [Stylophora pistillata]